MNTIAWLCVLIGAVILQRVSVGRTDSMNDDLKDLATGAITGDYDAVSKVWARRTVAGKGLGVGGSIGAGYAGSSELLSEARKLGSSASGYRIGATGPDYYDCSGLVWRALRNQGIYTGSRFTTQTFPGIASQFATEVASPTVGDIVVWPKGNGPYGHMGIVSGPDSFYSARSRRSGIGEGSISGFPGGNPRYFRIGKNTTQGVTI